MYSPYYVLDDVSNDHSGFDWDGNVCTAPRRGGGGELRLVALMCGTEKTGRYKYRPPFLFTSMEVTHQDVDERKRKEQFGDGELGSGYGEELRSLFYGYPNCQGRWVSTPLPRHFCPPIDLFICVSKTTSVETQDEDGKTRRNVIRSVCWRDGTKESIFYPSFSIEEGGPQPCYLFTQFHTFSG